MLIPLLFNYFSALTIFGYPRCPAFSRISKYFPNTLFLIFRKFIFSLEVRKATFQIHIKPVQLLFIRSSFWCFRSMQDIKVLAANLWSIKYYNFRLPVNFTLQVSQFINSHDAFEPEFCMYNFLSHACCIVYPFQSPPLHCSWRAEIPLPVTVYGDGRRGVRSPAILLYIYAHPKTLTSFLHLVSRSRNILSPYLYNTFSYMFLTILAPDSKESISTLCNCLPLYLIVCFLFKIIANS
jgi:hypothetical protein